MAMASNRGGNVCLTLHQPWASLLVHGIKRIEGRSWPSPIRGRLWIHAASKVPDPSTITAMEVFYREIYEVDGVTNIDFPKHYPVSVLLGCVNVVGCLQKDELESCEKIPLGVRLEGQTAFCWLCEDPQKLVIPLEMRGNQGVYNLPKKIAEAALRALRPAHVPAVMSFPQLEPSDLVPRKLGLTHEVPKFSQTILLNSISAKLDASIAGARTAALQFRKEVDWGNRQRPFGNSLPFSGRSSSGRANLDKSSFQFGQNSSFLWHEDRRERGMNLSDDFSRGGDAVSHSDGKSAGSRKIKGCRQATHVGNCDETAGDSVARETCKIWTSPVFGQNSSPVFGQSSPINRRLCTREKKTNLVQDFLNTEGGVSYSNGQSLSPKVMNVTRLAPRRVAAFRVLDKAVQDLSRRG